MLFLEPYILAPILLDPPPPGLPWLVVSAVPHCLYAYGELGQAVYLLLKHPISVESNTGPPNEKIFSKLLKDFFLFS